MDNTQEPPVSSPELTCITSLEHLLLYFQNTAPCRFHSYFKHQNQSCSFVSGPISTRGPESESQWENAFQHLPRFSLYNTCVAHASNLRNSQLLTAASIILLLRHTTKQPTRHADVSSNRVCALTVRFPSRRGCTLTPILAS